MAKKKSTPLVTVASDATGGQDNPGTTMEVDTSTYPGGAPDETFDATDPMVKKKSNPTATVASDATGGQDNPGVTTEIKSLIDPGRFDVPSFVLRSLLISLSYVSLLKIRRWWSTSINRVGQS
jgi:hypothetical protein